MFIPWWLPTVISLVGLAIGFLAHAVFARMRMAAAEQTARQILRNAELQAENLLSEAKLRAQEEALRIREEFEEETRARREELRSAEERLARREANLDRKVALLDHKEAKLEQQQAELERRQAETERRDEELQRLMAREQEELQRVAGLSREQAREVLLKQLEEEARAEASQLLRRILEEARASAERQAREIITTAIERYAADQAAQVTTCTVTLPNEEMKGRIIGREGRNIRALEAATGVDILIDEAPEVVVISGFDPLRREVARLALERLMADGRIQPARIEEVVAQVREELDETIRAAGEQAIYELGLQGVDPEVVRTLGRLKFRHSFAQNVLEHSKEMAHLMGMMAADLGLDPAIAKRVGLFHDIGKALDHQVDGPHALIGADFLRRHGESPVVFNAVAAHHHEAEATSPYAALAAAADAITASRPGARVEVTEAYLKRLEKLEAIANSFRGVEKSYAIQAGRELRVIVEPSKIDDHEALLLARNICKQIEQELEYPGQIKVTVIRETRCVEYAK